MKNIRKKIIFVDDNKASLSMGRTMLKNIYEVYPAPSAVKLFEILEYVDADLILLDILMPDMDGWETFGRIKAISLLHEVPIIFLSSIVDESDIDRAIKMGASGFITKPYSAEDLLAEVNKVLNGQK